jgi:hypothetical protein
MPPPVLLLPASLLPPKPPLLPPELPPLLPPREPLLPEPLPLMPPEPELLLPLCPACESLSSSWFWSFRFWSFWFLSGMLASLLDALANACRMPLRRGRDEQHGVAGKPYCLPRLLLPPLDFELPREPLDLLPRLLSPLSP